MCLLKMTLVFLSVSYFNNDGAQHYLILPPLYYTLNRLGDTEKTVSWRSKGLSAEKLTTPTTTSNSLSQSIKWNKNSKFCFIFKGIVLDVRYLVLFGAKNYHAIYNRISIS